MELGRFKRRPEHSKTTLKQRLEVVQLVGFDRVNQALQPPNELKPPVEFIENSSVGK